MLQLKNNSPFEASISVFPDIDGVDTLYIAIKSTFAMGEKVQVSDEQLPVTMADEFWGEPGLSSVKYGTELHLEKPGTDVVLLGDACAKDEKQSRQLDVMVSVGNREKVIRVFGDRYWMNGLMGMQISAPMPFKRMPLVYERAYGGTHEVDPERGEVVFEALNPVGLGYLGKRKQKEMDGKRLPNLEDPRSLIKYPDDSPRPASFGFIAPSWEPRKSYAGTYDERWQQSRAPYLPKDFNPRFFHAAHPDLTFPKFLAGGEPVVLYNVSPTGPIKFNLPTCDLAISTRIAGKSAPVIANLESVLFEPGEMRFSMLWRGGVRCDKKVLNVEQVDVALSRLDLNGGVS